ncbi:MAG: DUF4416 family protein [Thermodesulfobacteriota bacterium]
MSEPRDSLPVKLILSMITSEDGLIEEALERAEDMWGEVDFLSEKLPFNHTDYYEKEMGRNLFRRIGSFKKLISLESLPAVKHLSKELEDRYLLNHKRRINIDPGYIAREKMVMTTFKNFSHRIYLKDKVYADLTLIYRDKGFRSLEWTFPDYAVKGMRKLLKDIRESYVSQLSTQDAN